jgi:hypothetical protein
MYSLLLISILALSSYFPTAPVPTQSGESVKPPTKGPVRSPNVICRKKPNGTIACSPE